MSNQTQIQKLPPAVQVIAARRDRIVAQLPAHIKPDRFFEALSGIYADENVSKCTTSSLLACAYTIAKLGLEVEKVLGQVYVIPYSGVATIQIGYKGFLELGRRSGVVLAVETEIVYDCDKFERWTDENGKHFRHIPDDDRGPNAKPKLVYCSSQIAGGARSQVEFMPWFEIQKIKAAVLARGKSPAWTANEFEMARKTAVRRASKYWPQSPELGRAVHIDEQLERGEPQMLAEVEGAELPDAPRKRSLIAPDAPESTAGGSVDVSGVQPINTATVGKQGVLAWLNQQPIELLDAAKAHLGLADINRLTVEELAPLVTDIQDRLAEMSMT